MDPNSNSCSFLKVFDVLQPTKVEIPSDFVNLLWGEQIPYGDRIKLFAADNLWIVETENYGLGPVLGDGFGKVVTDSGLQKDDYLLFTSLGPSTLYLDVFKSCVLDNSFITSTRLDDDFIGQFYGSSYKGGSATLYVGDRFWNVKMEALSDKCAFTDGWSNSIRDLALDSRTTFIFTMAGYDTFKLSIFNHQTGTQMYFKKVDVYEHKEKVITNESDLDEDIAGDIVGECTRISSSVDVYQSPLLPTDVSRHLCLSLDNLHHVTVQNQKCELLKLGTRGEKSGNGFRYGFKKWPAFLKLSYIEFGSTMFFTYVKSSHRLMLTKVVHNSTKKRRRS
ncbi:putative transcription factor B3-Domain family [Helianthus debilis subsp. tardiflorus]